MAFNVQAIKYGWVALASLGVLTGTTIYIELNTRRQVKPEDIIEIVVGTHERCLATQYSTNPVSYYVSPPSFVRTWTSNVYTTNGVTVYTNIVTNTIGWHIDRDMMVSLDTTIKALVPYYCDTNTVYDGTTNIVMLTVTGLWASLGIGNKTNLFTREPCWTNSISTNWIIDYTSYWPSTNGAATNIVYTSDYRQVVNYAQSWTATGGHVWVTSSNWASEVVTVTNAATYGDYLWQIYAEDLVERYKVLNALKSTINFSVGNIIFTNINIKTVSGYPDYEEAAIAFPSATWVNDPIYGEDNGAWANEGWHGSGAEHHMGRIRGNFKLPTVFFNTNIVLLRLEVYAYLTMIDLWNGDDPIVPGNKNTYVRILNIDTPTPINFPYSSIMYGDSDLVIPGPGTTERTYSHDWELGRLGLSSPVGSRISILVWQFCYCTNKYW